MERKLESKIRKRFDQLYDDITGEGYNKDDIEELLNDLEDNLITHLDEFEEDDVEDEQ